MPWEFSLNLSAVVPESTTQLQPNRSNPVDSAGRPLISGFLLQITIEQNGMNTTYYYHMVGSQATAASNRECGSTLFVGWYCIGCIPFALNRSDFRQKLKPVRTMLLRVKYAYSTFEWVVPTRYLQSVIG